jgi:hypothetical protein
LKFWFTEKNEVFLFSSGGETASQREHAGNSAREKTKRKKSENFLAREEVLRNEIFPLKIFRGAFAPKSFGHFGLFSPEILGDFFEAFLTKYKPSKISAFQIWNWNIVGIA